MPIEALTSAEALDRYDLDHSDWGRGESAKVARLCQWFAEMGAKLDCRPR